MGEYYPDGHDEANPEAEEFIAEAIDESDSGGLGRVFVEGVVTDEALRHLIERLRDSGIEVIVPTDN